jgi:anti-sigma regulatory factor (Ser/Thr protein kinase)
MKALEKATNQESTEIYAYINKWMNEHPFIENDSSLIKLAIAEFVLNRQNKTLFK